MYFTSQVDIARLRKVCAVKGLVNNQVQLVQSLAASAVRQALEDVTTPVMCPLPTEGLR